MEFTEFPKKYDRQETEAKWREIWNTNKTYEFKLETDKPLYIVDTPPPYVSADHLHQGHIMSYSQAEFVVRFKRMTGYNVFYPMGFDDNGYPTERFVEKKYNVDKNSISKKEFVKLCLEETKNGSKNYKKLWNDLGISVDWTKTYSTISPEVVKVSQKSMKTLYEKGALYRKESPVMWAVKAQSALAQTDLDEKEFEAYLNYIPFSLETGEKLTIATSRPELLPACVSLYVNPNDQRYTKFIGKKAKVPIFDYEVEIRSIDTVDPEFGTGLMMVCTWGDQEDVEKWYAHNLDTREVLNKDGTMNSLAGEFEGMYFEDAREAIVQKLDSLGILEKREKIVHTVKVNDRDGVPVNFINSAQWFVKIVENKDIWLQQAEKINWYPEEKINDYKLWVQSLKWDWCISRQRYYGVPIPVWYDKETGEPYFVPDEYLPHDPTSDPCPFLKEYPDKEFVPETDVADTWMTSSCTPFMLKEVFGKNFEHSEKMYPVSLRPNAFEIIRTWDFYSIVQSYYNYGEIPFKDVMISGHGQDSEGRKISKRLGNYIPSEELLESYGADSIRYWATGAKLGGNLRFSEEEIKNGEKLTIKLWNASRFIWMNLASDDPEGNQKEFFKEITELKFNDIPSLLLDGITKLEESDVWILTQVSKVVTDVTSAFENYDYSSARQQLDNFFWRTFADYYLEFIKYRFFGNDTDSKKAAALTAYYVLGSIVKMYAPLIPFVTEEINSYLRFSDNLESLHTSSWLNTDALKEELNLDSDFESVLLAVDEIRKIKTENGLTIGKQMDSVSITTSVNLDKYKSFLQSVCRVDSIVFSDKDNSANR